jgi:hypothetical protein
MKGQSPKVPSPRVVVVRPGDVLTDEVLNAIADPERLISGRHARRTADGTMIARREFSVGLPA